MALSSYHQKYVNQSDDEVQNRVNEKRLELSEIFSKVSLTSLNEPAKIAVLGCGDKRYIKWHKEIFEGELKRTVNITTYDIVVDHLQGEENVVQHDCTLPLPESNFDVTYGHVLLRFIQTEKQWDLIKNSYNALAVGGLAIHVLDVEDYQAETLVLQSGLFSVPLHRWKKSLDEMGIRYFEIPIKYGAALVLVKEL